MRNIQNLLSGVCLILAAMFAAPNAVETANARPKNPTSEKTHVGSKQNVDKNGLILKGYDPVAYFKQGKAVKGNPSTSSSYNGAIFYFSSKANKADFDKSPAEYSPQYGGFCANSMSKHQLKDSDPNVFFIYKGKLYVCSSEEAVKEFSSKPEITIPKAEKNWQLYELPSGPGFRRELGS